MTYLRRYVVVDHGRQNIRAYDLYETMNRQEYFRQRSEYRQDAVARNLEALSDLRNHEKTLWECQFYCPRMPGNGGTEALMVLIPDEFFSEHGVLVPMEAFHEQEFENQMIDAAVAVEDAHLLWNLFDDGDEPSTATLSDLYSESDIEELMHDPIGEDGVGED